MRAQEDLPREEKAAMVAVAGGGVFGQSEYSGSVPLQSEPDTEEREQGLMVDRYSRCLAGSYIGGNSCNAFSNSCDASESLAGNGLEQIDSAARGCIPGPRPGQWQAGNDSDQAVDLWT